MPIERLAALILAGALMAGVIRGTDVVLADPLDKAVHFGAYLLLTLLLWRSTGLPLFALGAALAFGLLDEWRQAYLPGRESDARDLLADLAGVVVAFIWCRGKTARAFFPGPATPPRRWRLARPPDSPW
jgi:VanZ family protein